MNFPQLQKAAVAFLGAVAAFAFGPTPASAQYYYPPPYGYQYPPQYPQYPQQQPQYPQRQRPQRQERKDQPREQPRQSRPEQARPRKAAEPERPAAKPPSADLSAITGPFMAYTWDYADTFADLASATSTTTNQILALNNLSISQLRDGQVLKVPEIHSPGDLDIETDATDHRAREVWRGIRGSKRIALTFDAGGDPDDADLLLKNLTDNNAAATIFVTGQFVEEHPDIVKSFSDVGFPIHNHSWSHPDFTTISDAEIGDQLSRTDAKIEELTGKSSKPYWRPPFGERNDRVLRAAAREGYQSIYWTLDSLDSVGEPKSSSFVLNRVLSPPKHKLSPDHFLDGAIVLMHVGKTGTAEAIPEMVKSLRDRGFTLVTVDEILNP